MNTTTRDPRAVLALIVIAGACVLAIGALFSSRGGSVDSQHPGEKDAEVSATVERPMLPVIEERPILDGIGQRKSYESDRSLTEEAASALEEQRAAGSEVMYADRVDLLGARWVGLFRLADERGALMIEITELEGSMEGGSHVVEVTLDAEALDRRIVDE